MSVVTSVESARRIHRSTLLPWLGIVSWTWTAPSSLCSTPDSSPVAALEFIAPLSDEDFDGSSLRFEVAVTGIIPAEARVRYLVWSNEQHKALELDLRRADEAFDVSVEWLWCSLSGRKLLMIRTDVVVPYAFRSREVYGWRSLATAYVEFPLARVFSSGVTNETKCDEVSSANRATTLAPGELALDLDAPPFGSQELVRALDGLGVRMPPSTISTPSGMADGCTAVLWNRFEYSENAWDAENKVLLCAARVVPLLLRFCYLRTVLRLYIKNSTHAAEA
jgi:hypothetical protein